jgi:hypothetical protein
MLGKVPTVPNYSPPMPRVDMPLPGVGVNVIAENLWKKKRQNRRVSGLQVAAKDSNSSALVKVWCRIDIRS